MIKTKIKEFAKQLNIEYVSFSESDATSFIVFLFPYYTGDTEKSNISLYCRSVDYHLIVKSYLEKISSFIKDEFNIETEPFIDVNPENEVELAVKCGLGVKGKNHLLINEKYGTFVFIGVLKLNTYIEPDLCENKGCLNCNKCINSCIALKNNDFSLCVSEISQKKGELTNDEENALLSENTVFGCDRCQLVCPMNTFKKTPIPEFYENRISSLSSDMFNISNKEFKNLYKNRAFSWRGKNVLLRNLKLLEETNSQQE